MHLCCRTVFSFATLLLSLQFEVQYSVIWITLVTHHIIFHYITSVIPVHHLVILVCSSTSPLFCTFDSLNLPSFSIWWSPLSFLFYTCIFLFLFSTICFCLWCQDVVLHSMQFSLLSCYLLVLVFVPSFLSFYVIQHSVFLFIQITCGSKLSLWMSWL